MLRIAAALCLIATALAACGGDEKAPAATAKATPAKKAPAGPAELCKEISDAFEENEGAYFSATALDYLSPNLLPLAEKLERADPAAAGYAEHAKALADAADDRSLPRLRRTLQGMRDAARKVDCKLRPSAKDVEQIASPFYVNVLEQDYRAILRAMEGPKELETGPYLRLQRRIDRAVGRALARLAKHAPPPKPVRKVARRYIAAARAYRAAIRETNDAVLSGSDAMYELQHRDQGRALRRFQDAHVDVTTLL